MFLEKIDYKTFRSIDHKKGKYLCYFSPGIGYFRLKKTTAYGALKKQIYNFFEHYIVLREEGFEKAFSFTPIYIYNSILNLKNEDIIKPLAIWKVAVDLILENKPIKLLGDLNYEIVSKDRKLGTRIRGSGKAFLYLWLRSVIANRVRLRRCQAQNCDRVFIPSMKNQIYCSDNCRFAFYYRKKRDKRKKALLQN
ncbi:hypothetical protein ES705_05374 [subsurface metagenome]